MTDGISRLIRFEDPAGKTALITGATSGIGKSTAELFAKAGIKLILCGRRRERLETLKNELGTYTDVTILNFDIRDKHKVLESLKSLGETLRRIDILINNAGNAHGLSPFYEADTEDWDAMLDINVKGLLYVSRAVTPGMVERKSGHIINIGSIAGKEVYPNGNVYCASKFAVDALSRAMRVDLNAYNIKVSSVNPGLTETEFSLIRFKGDTQKAQAVYQGYQPLTPRDIAELLLFSVTRPYHVNLADAVMLPLAQADTRTVNREL